MFLCIVLNSQALNSMYTRQCSVLVEAWQTTRIWLDMDILRTERNLRPAPPNSFSGKFDFLWLFCFLSELFLGPCCSLIQMAKKFKTLHKQSTTQKKNRSPQCKILHTGIKEGKTISWTKLQFEISGDNCTEHQENSARVYHGLPSDSAKHEWPNERFISVNQKLQG